jgi:hypothetical protein
MAPGDGRVAPFNIFAEDSAREGGAGKIDRTFSLDVVSGPESDADLMGLKSL